ncbi:MAG: NAD(P)H-binding protein [Actinomycetota bacterium]|nr:NAD(P)H-binding protein [Actinomycetota bacterium]
MRVAVLGATGFIGRVLVPVLAELHEVVAVSRSGASPAQERVRALAADANDAAALRRALDGVDVVYHLVHSLGARDFRDRDRLVATTVAAAAERARVSQIVYLGGLGDHRSDLSSHLRSRAETAVALSRGAVPVTTLRTAVVVGRGSAGFETIVALVDRLPVMLAPTWVSTPTQPIALHDVVGYLAGVAGRSDTIGRTFDVGGPEVLTYREMIERVGRLRGRHPRILELSLLTPRLSSYWLHLVTPVRARVARPLVEGLRNPTVARGHGIRRILPRTLTPFEDAAREALASPAV